MIQNRASREIFLPSVNVAFDTIRLDELPRFRFSSKTVYLIRQFTNSCVTSTAEKAWSIVGTYGSGKSMFALLLCSLFGEATESDWTRQALSDLQQIDADLAATIETIRAAGRYEIVTVGAGDSLLRSLIAALEPLEAEGWARRGPKTKDFLAFIDLLDSLHSHDYTEGLISPTEFGRLVDLAASFATRVGRLGLIIVFDEFGRTIERSIARGEFANMYAIQEFAEAANRSITNKVHVLTLLHQNFESYASGVTRRYRIEWAKVQGRFRQISFIEEPEALLASVADVLDLKPLHGDRQTWLRREWLITKDLPSFRDDAAYWLDMLPRLYPLGAVAAYLLPRLASLTGQNERTTYAFLLSDDPSALPARAHSLNGPNEAIRADYLCDYFLLRGRSSYLDPRVQASLAELLIALEKTQDEIEASVVKVIAVLGLVGGPLWPTQGVIAAALGIEADSSSWELIDQALHNLTEQKTVVHRRYSGEYHLWRGTDLDIGLAVEEKRFEISADFDLPAFLNERMSLAPYVARRVTFETGTSRIYARMFVSPEHAIDATYLAGLFDRFAPSPDGLVLYVLATQREDLSEIEQVCAQVAKPIMFVVPAAPLDIGDLALDLMALNAFMQQVPGGFEAAVNSCLEGIGAHA
jgi:hypothetical protein